MSDDLPGISVSDRPGLKEVISLGGNIDSMVPDNVAKALKKKLLAKKMTF